MAEIDYEIDAAKALRALNDLAAAEKRLNEAAADGEKKLTAQEKAAQRLAEQVNPTARYERKLTDVARAVRDGGLALDDAQKLAEKYSEQLDRATGKTKKGAEALNVFGGLARNAFGDVAIAKLVQFGAQFATVQGAIGLVNDALRRMEEEATAAFESTSQAYAAQLELQQLANAPENVALSRRIAAEGIASEAVGAKIAFQTQSSGITGADRDFLVFKLGASGAIAPEDLADVGSKAKKVQTSFRIGGFDETLQKLFATSDATDSNVRDISVAAAKFGSSFNALGFSDTEGLAALATLIQEIGAEEGGTGLRSFASQVNRRGLKKGSLRETILSIKEQVDAGKNVFDVVGDTVAVSTYQQLANNLGFYDTQRGLIAGAPAADIIGKRDVLLDPTSKGYDSRLAAQRLRNIAIGRQTQGAGAAGEGEKEALLDAVYADLRFSSRSLVQDELRLIGPTAAAAADRLQQEPLFFRQALEADDVTQITEGRRRLDPRTRSGVEGYLRRIAEATEAQNQAQGRQE